MVDASGELGPSLPEMLGVSWPRERRHHLLNDKGIDGNHNSSSRDYRVP